MAEDQTPQEKKAAAESKKAAGKGVQAAPLAQPADTTKRADMGPIETTTGDEGVTTTGPNAVAQAVGLQSANAETHLALVDAPGPDGKEVSGVDADENGRAKSAVYERYLAKSTDVTPLYRLIVAAGAPMTEVARETLKKAAAGKPTGSRQTQRGEESAEQ